MKADRERKQEKRECRLVVSYSYEQQERKKKDEDEKMGKKPPKTRRGEDVFYFGKRSGMVWYGIILYSLFSVCCSGMVYLGTSYFSKVSSGLPLLPVACSCHSIAGSGTEVPGVTMNPLRFTSLPFLLRGWLFTCIYILHNTATPAVCMLYICCIYARAGSEIEVEIGQDSR